MVPTWPEEIVPPFDGPCRQRFKETAVTVHREASGSMPRLSRNILGVLARSDKQRDELVAEIMPCDRDTDPRLQLRRPPLPLQPRSVADRSYPIRRKHKPFRRAHDLGIITERQQRYLFQRIASRGWKLEEPKQFNVPVERPRLLRKIAEVLYGKPINYGKLAADMKLAVPFVRGILESYAEKPGEKVSGTEAEHASRKVIPIRLARRYGHRH